MIVTHPHHDHYAQAGRIAEQGAAQVWIAEMAAPALLQRESVYARSTAYYGDEFLPGLGLSAAETQRAVQGLSALYCLHCAGFR